MSIEFRDCEENEGSRMSIKAKQYSCTKEGYISILSTNQSGNFNFPEEVEEIMTNLNIETAIQFRKELQRQIMKAKALEKEVING